MGKYGKQIEDNDAKVQEKKAAQTIAIEETNQRRKANLDAATTLIDSIIRPELLEAKTDLAKKSLTFSVRGEPLTIDKLSRTISSGLTLVGIDIHGQGWRLEFTLSSDYSSVAAAIKDNHHGEKGKTFLVDNMTQEDVVKWVKEFIDIVQGIKNLGD